jgi:urea transporter
MKSRIAMWAALGASVAAFWAVYISKTMQNLKNPDSFSGILIRITCPIALANHHAISLYQVLLANAVTYAVVGAVVEILRRRSRLQPIPN